MTNPNSLDPNVLLTADRLVQPDTIDAITAHIDWRIMKRASGAWPAGLVDTMPPACRLAMCIDFGAYGTPNGAAIEVLAYAVVVNTDSGLVVFDNTNYRDVQLHSGQQELCQHWQTKSVLLPGHNYRVYRLNYYGETLYEHLGAPSLPAPTLSLPNVAGDVDLYFVAFVSQNVSRL